MYLGIDLGTGSVKVLLLSEAGEVVSEASRPYSVDSRQPGWAETDPEQWWRATVSAVLEAVQGHTAQVKAIGLSGQMHSLVLCDTSGAPLRPAMLWADTRSSESLTPYQRLNERSRARLGNPLVAGMTGPALLWVREHQPEIYRSARHALLPKDWLRLRLTGEVATDPSDASATLLYALEDQNWDFELLEALGLSPDLLPPIVPSSAVAGLLTPEAALELNLPANLPVACGAGDTAAALLGGGLLRSGAVQLTVGSGAQLVAEFAQPRVHPHYATHCYRTAALSGATESGWYAMAALQNAGLALEFARRILGFSWDVAYGEAFGVSSSEGALFLPYLSGERTPVLDATVRGGWLGLGLGHTPAHLMRAAFEGVALSIRSGLEALREVGVRPSTLRVAGGGTLEPRWRQLLSDALDLPLYGVEVSSVSARGAALLATQMVGQPLSTEVYALEVAAPQRQGREALERVYASFVTLYPRVQGLGRPDTPGLAGPAGPAGPAEPVTPPQEVSETALTDA